MGDSGKSLIGLLILGVGYAIIKLGDEFFVFFDEIVILLDESLLFRSLILDIFRIPFEVGINMETIVLGLLATFFLFAIVDYVAGEI